MATQQQDKQPTEREIRETKQQLSPAIAKQVMLTLGQPRDLHRVQVRHLWSDHYRVNVLIGQDAATAKIAHSFFLVADGEGNVSTSTPKIVKQY